MSNQVYDILKFIAQIALPAIGTLYFALAEIWGLPLGEQVVGTIVAVDAFLGALLSISTAQYNKTTLSLNLVTLETKKPLTYEASGFLFELDLRGLQEVIQRYDIGPGLGC